MKIPEDVIHQKTIDRLLEEDNPFVRYFTLRNLLKKPGSDPEIPDAKHAIMATGVVPAILSKQESGVYWGQPDNTFTLL